MKVFLQPTGENSALRPSQVVLTLEEMPAAANALAQAAWKAGFRLREAEREYAPSVLIGRNGKKESALDEPDRERLEATIANYQAKINTLETTQIELEAFSAPSESLPPVEPYIIEGPDTELLLGAMCIYAGYENGDATLAHNVEYITAAPEKVT